jgi:hypothetical protein
MDKRVRPDDVPTEGTHSPEIWGGGYKELKMLFLFKTANKANVSATNVHVIHPTKLQFPSTRKTSLFHDTESDTMTIKILSFAS